MPCCFVVYFNISMSLVCSLVQRKFFTAFLLPTYHCFDYTPRLLSLSLLVYILYNVRAREENEYATSSKTKPFSIENDAVFHRYIASFSIKYSIVLREIQFRILRDLTLNLSQSGF
jgi:hypothetical protein